MASILTRRWKLRNIRSCYSVVINRTVGRLGGGVEYTKTALTQTRTPPIDGPCSDPECLSFSHLGETYLPSRRTYAERTGGKQGSSIKDRKRIQRKMIRYLTQVKQFIICLHKGIHDRTDWLSRLVNSQLAERAYVLCRPVNGQE